MSCRRKKKRDVLGSRKRGAAGSSFGCLQKCLTCVHLKLSRDVDENKAKCLLEKETAASPTPSHPQRVMGRTCHSLWKHDVFLRGSSRNAQG